VFFGLTVIHRDVKVIDAGIQDGVQDALRLTRGQWPADACKHAA
jgi:hypothetical protein